MIGAMKPVSLLFDQPTYVCNVLTKFHVNRGPVTCFLNVLNTHHPNSLKCEIIQKLCLGEEHTKH